MATTKNSNVKMLLCAGAAVLGYGGYAWFNSSPQSSRADGSDPMDEYVMYGIGESTASLVRYDFAANTLSTIATIQHGSIDLTGLRGAAYVPGSSKLMSFWKDPSDGLSKLVYVNMKTAQGMPIGTDLGRGVVTAAVAAMPQPSTLTLAMNEPTPAAEMMQYELYATQETEGIDFAITDDEVVPNETFAVRVTTLGAAISLGETYDMPVAMKVQVGSNTYEPFGSFSQPVNANLNDDADDEVDNDPADSPRHYVIPNTFASGTAVTIYGQTWTLNSGASGHSNSDWSSSLITNSNTQPERVITLRDGDPVPNIPGFLNQSSLAVFLDGYIDYNTDTIVLKPSQAIYCFELGNSLTGSAADFQDLVVLVTLAQDTTVLPDPDYPSVGQLIKVDTKDATITKVMDLERVYDGLAATSAQMFYGTVGNEIYLIDPSAENETLLGAMSGDVNAQALEFAGTTLYRYSTHNNHLREVDTVTGGEIDGDVNVGTPSNLGSILFARVVDEPITNTATYD